jgi:hypothetical protein
VIASVIPEMGSGQGGVIGASVQRYKDVGRVGQ